MNKMMVVIFDGETVAATGARALRQLHAEGDVTLYAMALIVRDVEGRIAVKEAAEQRYLGTAVGLAVGGLVGLLGCPVGPAGCAATGSATRRLGG